MIDLTFLKRLIETVEASQIDTLEISRWATKIRISKSPTVIVGANAGSAASPASENAGVGSAAPTGSSDGVIAASEERGSEAEEETKYVEVQSPMVGTFYRAPAPDAEPYVEVGDHVREGQTLCILEAMKLMNELEAEVAGTIKEIPVENAEPVEYGQVLFRLLPD